MNSTDPVNLLVPLFSIRRVCFLFIYRALLNGFQTFIMLQSMIHNIDEQIEFFFGNRRSRRRQAKATNKKRWKLKKSVEDELQISSWAVPESKQQVVIVCDFRNENRVRGF